MSLHMMCKFRKFISTGSLVISITIVLLLIVHTQIEAQWRRAFMFDGRPMDHADCLWVSNLIYWNIVTYTHMHNTSTTNHKRAVKIPLPQVAEESAPKGLRPRANPHLLTTRWTQLYHSWDTGLLDNRMGFTNNDKDNNISNSHLQYRDNST